MNSEGEVGVISDLNNFIADFLMYLGLYLTKIKYVKTLMITFSQKSAVYIFSRKGAGGSKAVRSFSKNASIWWVEASLSWDVTSSLCQKKKWNFASETWGHLERGMETPENNFQIYRPINDPWQAVCSLERGYRWGNIQKSFLGDNFWLECPTDLRSTPLSYIFSALFGDTHSSMVFARSQIAK